MKRKRDGFFAMDSRMRKVHARARQALTDHLWRHQPDADQLVGVLSTPRSAVRGSTKSKCGSEFWRVAYSNADRSNQLTNGAGEFWSSSNISTTHSRNLSSGPARDDR